MELAVVITNNNIYSELHNLCAYVYLHSTLLVHTYVCIYVIGVNTTLNSRSYKERFSETTDVEASFLYLLNKLETLWSTVDFSELKKICKRDNRLSEKLRSDVKNASNLEETFDILSTSPFCTWLELRILKRMAKVAEVPEATQMINVFEECVHYRKCSEVQPYFREKYINPDHLTLVEAKLNQSADKLMVCDLIKYCHTLESLCKIPAESSTLISSKEGCLKLCFSVPTYCSLHAYEMAKNNFFRLRPFHIQYLQIGTFQKIYAIGSTNTNSDDPFLSWISCIDNCKLSIIICIICT